MAPVMLVHLLIAAWGWSWGLAVATGLLASILLGAIVEMAVIRRFRKAPRLLLTVATIGLAQVLGGIAITLPALFDEMVLSPQLDPPFNLYFTFGGWNFGPPEVIALIAVQLLVFAPAVQLGTVAYWERVCQYM